ncbi:MAG: CbiX/SirB N-terminal domain-containing protein [Acidimicrobiia bacterium]
MTDTTALILVDHGSRRGASNTMFEQFVEAFRTADEYVAVEAAHMELASPTIADAYDKCVAAGATTIVVCPYFLLPGRHWDQDIPTLTAEAATRHPGTQFLVTAPIGLHPLMREVITNRVQECVAHASGTRDACTLCAGTDRCALRDSGWTPTS